jgi:predicted enzyme related to lactoylglutathione lyase
MKPQSVKYMLMAQDMDRAVAFYCDTLGFSAGFINPHWSELHFGDAILALHGGGDGSKNPTGFSIQYEDVRAAHAAAIAAGAVEIRAPELREVETIILAEIQDPEGNVIKLTQYIGDT